MDVKLRMVLYSVISLLFAAQLSFAIKQGPAPAEPAVVQMRRIHGRHK